jgi:hypothetical protein
LKAGFGRQAPRTVGWISTAMEKSLVEKKQGRVMVASPQVTQKACHENRSSLCADIHFGSPDFNGHTADAK